MASSSHDHNHLERGLFGRRRRQHIGRLASEGPPTPLEVLAAIAIIVPLFEWSFISTCIAPAYRTIFEKLFVLGPLLSVSFSCACFQFFLHHGHIN